MREPISLEDYPSSFDIAQRNPDPNKKAVVALYRKNRLYAGANPFCAPLKNGNGWGIWSNTKKVFAKGRTPSEAWLNALIMLGGVPVTVSKQRPHHSGAL